MSTFDPDTGTVDPGPALVTGQSQTGFSLKELPAMEPVVTGGAVTTLVGAVLVLLYSFDWWTPTEEQRNAVLAVFVALSGVVTPLLVRRKTTPMAGQVGGDHTDG